MPSASRAAADPSPAAPLVYEDAEIAALSRTIDLPIAHFDRAVTDRRLAALAPDAPGALVHRTRVDARLRARARRAVVNSQTGMFRDPRQFDILRETVLPRLAASSRRLTVWSAGCADGSELISVASVLDELGLRDGELLLGSDLLAENVKRARALAREHAVDGLRWEQRDIVEEGAPRGGWRLVICRNVAIHLAPAARARLHDAVTGALARDGVILLGRSERLSDAPERGLTRIAPNTYARA